MLIQTQISGHLGRQIEKKTACGFKSTFLIVLIQPEYHKPDFNACIAFWKSLKTRKSILDEFKYLVWLESYFQVISVGTTYMVGSRI